MGLKQYCLVETMTFFHIPSNLAFTYKFSSHIPVLNSSHAGSSINLPDSIQWVGPSPSGLGPHGDRHLGILYGSPDFWNGSSLAIEHQSYRSRVDDRFTLATQLKRGGLKLWDEHQTCLIHQTFWKLKAISDVSRIASKFAHCTKVT